MVDATNPSSRQRHSTRSLRVSKLYSDIALKTPTPAMCLPFEGLNIRYKGLLFQIVKADGYLSTMMSQTDTGLLSNPEGVAAYSPGFAEPARTSLLAEPWGKRNRNQFRAIDIAMSAVNSPLGTKAESTQPRWG